MSRQALAAGVAWVFATALLGQPAAPGEWSAKEIKKVHRQAGKAFEAGDLDAALELYRKLVAGAPTADSRRSDALYALALIHLSPEPGWRDRARAVELLEELASSDPRYPRHREVAALLELLPELADARREIERRSHELAAEKARCDAERRRAEAEREEIAGESEAADSKLRTLRAQLRKTQDELTQARAELEKKEQALQKLKEALVGRAEG